ncbi:heme-binding protein [Bacteriovorax sp. Seq25_V]|uniref:GlcG/HbpS family heme-binding protein n=1 Tax=Bacteriovorax sp. Seq25_V TaxID=1201288 RepID=UPI000389FA76|nr:heme-binding protein [Bacteriovorax sp. Seq25_V]EQC45507.1 PF03928 domain protein [Bacteriovorax sp. Seq25_V]
MANLRGITSKQAFNILDSGIRNNEVLKGPPLSFVILDNGGHVKLAHSQDGCSIARYEIALGKAYAALAMGFNSREFYNYVKQGILPELFGTAINGSLNGKFIPQPGGVLIKDGDEIIGAIGISGASSDYDEDIAIKAIADINLQ